MLIPYALYWLLLVQSVDGQIWKLFEGCYRMTTLPGSAVQKLDDRLNNNKCINFCRDKAFPLAATSDKKCVCVHSLPTTLLAISTDGDAASGSSSSCNTKCPGDAGETCYRTSCCGGPNNAYNIYATGEVDYLGQLLNLLETHKNTIQTNALGLPEGGRFSYWVEFYSPMPDNKVKRCAFVSTVEINDDGHRFDQVQKGCGDYTESTDDLKRVDLNVVSVKKEASKPYPTRETPLQDDFDVELDNTAESFEKEFTKSRTVEATTSQSYSIESGTESSFTIGASVSAGFKAMGAEFEVSLSTEISSSSFYNTGYEQSADKTISTSFEISATVPAGVKTIARFSKRIEPLTLKWSATIHAEGEIKLSYLFSKFGHQLKPNQTVTVSLSQAIPSEESVFYTMGTVRADTRAVISAKMDSYNAQGTLIESKPASSSEVSETESSGQRDPGHPNMNVKHKKITHPKHKKNTDRGKY